MVDHLVHEVTVVAHYDHTAGEILKVFLEDLKGHDVEVVRRLVEYEEIGVLHQHRTEVELAPLTTRELIHIVMLLFGREEEILQELRGGEMLAATHIDIFSDVADDIDDFLLFIKLQSLLREIAEAHGIADVETAFVGWHLSQEQLEEGGLACAVVAHDAHLLEPREIIVEVLEDDQIVEAFRHILALEDLRTDIHVRRLQPELSLLDTLLRHALQFVEGLLTIAGLVTTCLGHASHPLEFGAIEVVGARNLRPSVVDALLTLLQIVGVIAAIGIDGLVVEFENQSTDTVEEKTVVGDHQQRLTSTGKIALEPFNHLKVEMVGGFVEDQQIGLREQNIGQGHTLLLTTGQLSHGLLKVADLQLRQHLFRAQHLFWIPLMVEAGIEHALLRVEHGRLLQHAHLQVATEDDTAAVVTLLAREHGEQRRLARTVLGYQAHLLSLSNGEADILEEHQRAKRLGQVLYV